MGAQHGSGILRAVGVCPVSLGDAEERLREHVRAQGLSVKRLARRCGLSQPCLANWLAGRRSLSRSGFDVVRHMCGIGWCDLFGCDQCPRMRSCGGRE